MNLRIRGLLDRSGSMAAWHKPVVEGMNDYLDKVRQDSTGSGAELMIVTFDSMGFDVIRKGKAADVRPLTEDDFKPRALTPLYDSVGSALTDNVSEAPGDRNILFILTDGLENASKKYTTPAIRQLVESKQRNGWIIIYLGANIDAWKAASDMGIPPERTMNVHVQGRNSQQAPGFVNRIVGKKSNPIGMALAAAAGLGLAYALMRPSDAAASGLGFTEQDRNAAMGVDGTTKTWQQAVQEDIEAFDEPFSSMFDLPQELVQQIADQPKDFDPAQGSMNAAGDQSGGLDIDSDILSADDVPSLVNEYAPPSASTRELETVGGQYSSHDHHYTPPSSNTDSGGYGGGGDSGGGGGDGGGGGGSD